MSTSGTSKDWDKTTGRSLSLEEWLARVLDPKAAAAAEYLIDYDFPTDQHADEYFATIDKRPEHEVVALLRRFLFPSCCFPQADAMQFAYLRHLKSEASKPPPDVGINDAPVRDPEALPIGDPGVPLVKMMSFDELLKREHTNRLLASVASGGKVPSWDGIRWVLDLLPHFPRPTIDALDAYILAHAQLLPDGRFSGLSQAAAIIRAKFIQTVPNDAGDTLRALCPREFEFLAERLFFAMGYETQITTATRDGGRDVIAVRTFSAMRERVLVECKLYNRSKVGVSKARELLGVITNEHASRGVILTTGHVTTGAARFDQRIEVVGRSELFRLLNEHFGNKWTQHVDSIIRDGMRANSTK